MPRLRAAERTLSLLTSSSTTPYVCRTCRTHLLRRRTLHTSNPLLAEQSWLKRMQNSLFGSAESKEAGIKRDEARKKQLEDLSNLSEEERRGANVTTREGREYEIAQVVDPSLDKGYVAATDWEGLERVGGEGWLKKRADKGEKYSGFITKTPAILSDDTWKSVLQNVAVEVLALQQAGRDIEQVCYQRSKHKRTAGQARTRRVNIAVDGAGVTLVPADETAIGDILSNIPETSPETIPSHVQFLSQETKGVAGRANRQSPATGLDNDGWLQFPLSDPAIKFTILKRTTQLTGHRLRDSVASSARTLADLHAALRTPEKPKKLAHSQEIHALRAENPNVTVQTSRRTSIDKHKEVGRWKVIEDELTQRGLPVTGSRWSRDAKTVFGTGDEGKGKKKKGARKSIT